MTDGGGNSDCQGARHQFELSGASLRFMRNLAMYMPRPVYNHQFKLGVPGNQTSSSNTENIHTAATILIQAQRGLILLCGHATPIGISHAAKSTPNRIFSPRFIGIAGVVAILPHSVLLTNTEENHGESSRYITPSDFGVALLTKTGHITQ
jgi:hypothetical protein